MRVRGAAATVAGITMLGCFSLSAQEIDLTSLKCKDFIRAPQEQVSSIMLWLGGYYTDEDDTPIINLARLKNKETQLRQYCLDNQGLLLLEASEIFMDKKYHN
jgi:hypothetical protein